AVVDTGKKLDPTDNWFTGRQILLPPSKIGAVLVSSQLLTTTLTRKEIEESPTTMSDRPVAKQSEEGNYNALGWPVSWYAPDEETKPWDPHLRSTKEVTGYHVQSLDGEIGHVADFIMDDVTWTIRYWVIATRNWWPGKKVLLLPQRIQEIYWDESKVNVSLFRSQIQSAPEFTDSLELTPDYETVLADYDAKL
ncbi:PRC-barrel domain containing protein, partial [Armatimonas sp.]|uniref:PRC-barrel domain containing protein n=1 Tax=Armatimonas sp. TaxID=1872638 RepID=UPI003751E26F